MMLHERFVTIIPEKKNIYKTEKRDNIKQIITFVRIPLLMVMESTAVLYSVRFLKGHDSR